MGKVKIRVIGDEQLEQEQKEEQKKKREGKKKAVVHGVGLGGGQRISAVGVSEEEIAKELETKVSEVSRASEVSEAKPVKKTKRGKRVEARARSKRHVENSSIVAKKTTYPITAGIEILRKFKKSNFDETVELHINTKEKGISGTVALPHGTGKKLRIKVADDAIIAEVEQGKINFDILVATPDMMPKLAKIAKILGPRGLMPNPKNGTISNKPEQVVEKLSAGQITYKTESAVPIIHQAIGKLSFDDRKLSENIESLLASIGSSKINSATLKSTMSPGIRLQI